MYVNPGMRYDNTRSTVTVLEEPRDNWIRNTELENSNDHERWIRNDELLNSTEHESWIRNTELENSNEHESWIPPAMQPSAIGWNWFRGAQIVLSRACPRPTICTQCLSSSTEGQRETAIVNTQSRGCGRNCQILFGNVFGSCVCSILIGLSVVGTLFITVFGFVTAKYCNKVGSVYMAVFGVFTTFKVIYGTCRRVRNWCTNRERDCGRQQNVRSSHCDILMNLFLFAWTIAGHCIVDIRGNVTEHCSYNSTSGISSCVLSEDTDCSSVYDLAHVTMFIAEIIYSFIIIYYIFSLIVKCQNRSRIVNSTVQTLP